MQPDVPELDPEVEAEIRRQTFNFQEHDWQQEGTYVVCRTCNDLTSHAFHVKPGQMLVGNRGEWSLEKEGGRVKY